MKITLAFLIVGVCLVSTNAQKRMKENDAYGHARMMTLVMARWGQLQNCQKCSDVERNCMQRAILTDFTLIVKLMANDMGCRAQDLFVNVRFKFDATVFYKAVETGDCDQFTNMVINRGLLDHFIQSMCGAMDGHLKAASVDLAETIASVNNVLEGILDGAIELVKGVLSGLLKLADGLVSDVGNAVGGALNGVIGENGLLGNMLSGGNIGGLLGGGSNGGLLGGVLGDGKKGGLGSLLG